METEFHRYAVSNGLAFRLIDAPTAFSAVAAVASQQRRLLIPSEDTQNASWWVAPVSDVQEVYLSLLTLNEKLQLLKASPECSAYTEWR